MKTYTSTLLVSIGILAVSVLSAASPAERGLHLSKFLANPIAAKADSAMRFDPQAFSCTSVTEIPYTECEVLVVLYNSTNGANWIDHTNWLVTLTPCSWFGVVCSNKHVTELNLGENELKGNLPTELYQLTKLTNLSLNDNQLSGEISASIGLLSSLKTLDLYGNELSGTIPVPLAILTNLIDLSLGYNELSGSVPPQLGQLVNLTNLALNHNQLTGGLPRSFTQLTKLQILQFEDTQLCESIDVAFQAWLAAISLSVGRTGVVCSDLKLVSLKLEPAAPRVGEPFSVRFEIENSSGQEITVGRIGVGLRGPDACKFANPWDAPKPPETFDGVDNQTFPAFARREFVSPFKGAKGFEQPGVYILEPVYVYRDRFPAFQNSKLRWFNVLKSDGSRQTPNCLVIVEPLTISPPNPKVGEMVQATFKIQNKTDHPIVFERLNAAGRRGIDWSGANADFPDAPSNLTLQSGESYTYFQSKIFAETGDYFAEPWRKEAGDAAKYYTGGIWGGNRVTFQVIVPPTLSYIEVTQAIQCINNPDCFGPSYRNWCTTHDCNNAVPLLLNKPTWVRVYVKSEQVDGTRVTGLLKGFYANGTELPLSPLRVFDPYFSFDGVISHTTGGDRGKRADSLNFRLPIEWTRQDHITLEARIYPYRGDLSSSFDMKQIALAFTERNSLPIYSWRFRFSTQVATVNEVRAATAFMAQVYPLNSNVVDIQDQGELDVSDKSWEKLINALSKACFDLSKKLNNPKIKCYGWVPKGVDISGSYYGWTASGGSNKVVSVGYIYRTPLAGGQENLAPQYIFAHEIGHTLPPINHVATITETGGCKASNSGGDFEVKFPNTTGSIGEYGFGGEQPNQPIYVPKATPTIQSTPYYDFMSYCGVSSNHQWVSPYTYKHLYDALGSPGLVQASSTDMMSTQEYIIVSGIIAPDDSVTIYPFYREVYPLGIDDFPGNGAYSIELQDVQGNVLFTRFFDQRAAELPIQGSPVHFFEVLPFLGGTSRVHIKHNTTLLREISASANAPQVTVLAPLLGQNVADTVEIHWVGTDVDSDPLYYLVEYSADSGNSWRTIGYDLTDTFFVANANDLPGTTQAKIRILASDGFNTGSGESSLFSVPRKSPQVSVLSPANGELITPGQWIYLSGLAEDREDGPLNDAVLAWTLDRVTSIGNGQQLTLFDLSPGQHSIALTATDSDGNASSTSIDVYVGYRNYLPLLIVNGGTSSGQPTATPTSITNDIPTPTNVSSTPTATHTPIPPTPTFTPTPGQPPAAPSNLRATVLDANRIQLAWQDNASNETGFTIYEGGAQVAQTVANITTYVVAGLAPNSYHCYQVYAFNGYGNSPASEWACAMTGGLANTPTATPIPPTATNTPVLPTATDTPKPPTNTPVRPTATNTPLPPPATFTPTFTPVSTPTATPGQPPAAPNNLQATALDTSRVRLTWRDNANNETGFAIYDGDIQVATVNANTTTYTVQGLAPGSYHCFHLYAFNNFGNSVWTDWACAVTLTPTNTPTSTPTHTPTPTPDPCPRKAEGDADCDGKITIVDYEIWRKEYNGTLTTKTADFNRDGVVDMVDFAIWQAHYPS